MNTKKILLAAALGLTSLGFAQEKPSELVKADLLKNVDINLLLRAAYEAPYSSVSTGANAGNVNGLRQNETRLEIRGKIVDNLDFRVRTRLKNARAESTLDTSTGNLDIAYAEYKFGEGKKWAATIGKQANHFGSWEFEKNPNFEYQYSNLVGGYTNIFGMGAKLAYQINPNNNIAVQAYNTHNDTFQSRIGANANGAIRSRTPMGFNLTWMGNMWDKKFRTFWSLGTSEYASEKRNYQIALGNKLVLPKFEAYLDLVSTTFGFDHTKTIDSGVYGSFYGANKYGEDINIKTAVLRMDYQFIPQWFLTAKGYYETTSATKDAALGNNFRVNTGYLVGLEYQPIKSQNFKFFTYYYKNDVKFGGGVANRPAISNSVFSIGALYFVNVL